MLAEAAATLEARARSLVVALVESGVANGDRTVGAVETLGRVGGGTFPDVTIPGWGVRIGGAGATSLAAVLRSGPTPLVARIEDEAVVLDLRTVPASADDAVLEALRAAVTAVNP